MDLDEAPQTGLSRAETAFRLVAQDFGSSRSSSGWICNACGATVLDYGPEAGHPSEAEQGYADGCERLAAAVRAYEAED